MDDKEYFSYEKTTKYETFDHVGCVHNHNLDIKANHIYLVGNDNLAGSDSVEGLDEPGVEFSMANTFIRNLNILMNLSRKPILIHMKTCGGSWTEGMAIYDAIKTCPNHITGLVYTHARSMSSLILQAADKRVMMPHSTYMFHGGSMSYSGTSKQFMTQAEELQKSQETMVRIYVDSMKKNGVFKNRSKKFIEEWVVSNMDKKEEVFLTAQETVKYGLADMVFGENGYDWPGLLEFNY